MTKPPFPHMRSVIAPFARLTKRFAATRWGRKPVTLLCAGLLLMWGWAVLGPDLPFLIILLALAATAMWILRHRRDIAYSVGIIACTAAAPVIVVLLMASAGASGTPAVAAVLTGYILAAPLPTLTAWALRPPITSRPRSALLGSLLLLIGAVPVTVFGDHGFGTSVLVGSVAAACGLVWVRHRRALARRLMHLPVRRDGWTDLGARVLPAGSELHKVLVRRGYVVAATLTTGKIISPGALRRTMNRAIDLAAAAGVPPTRVQPVLFAPRATSGTGHHHITAGGATGTVLVTASPDLLDITALAPRSHRRGHRCLLTAATLDVPEGHTT